MFGVLLTLMILDGLLLMVIVLLQSGKGGGLAAMGGGGGTMGTEGLVGGRQAATILTKATWITGALFLVLALMLSIMSTSAQQTPDSVLQGEFQQSAPANPQPVLPGVEQEPSSGAEATPEAGGAGASGEAPPPESP